MTARSLRSIFQLKVTLKGLQPPVWRRLQVASTDSLEDFHLVLQIAMGWADEHLHQFVKGRDYYGEPNEEYDTGILDEADYRLEHVFNKVKDKIIYEYDFGDGWVHEIVLEKILPFAIDVTLPVCVKGSNACPPEDIGGVGGYKMFLETISDPSHPEYEEMLEWIGGGFDSTHFDLAETNDLLREYCD